MAKMFIIGRQNPTGKMLYIQNDDGYTIAFDSIEHAKKFLYENGWTDDKIIAEGIVFEELEVRNNVPEFLENFIFDIWSCCNEADYSVSYELDDYFRLAATADEDGWNCELLCHNTIDNDDVVVKNEFIHKTNFREIPEAISRLHDHYEETKENDDESESDEDEEDDEPDCQICGCQTDILLVKDFDGKGFDKRLCPKCLLNEALKKGKIILSKAHFEKDGVMLPVFDYLNTILDIEPLKKSPKKHNNLYYFFKEDMKKHLPTDKVEAMCENLGINIKKELDTLNTFIDGVEITLDYSEPVSEKTYEQYKKAIARREELTKLLNEMGEE